eukprot:60963_1
MAVNNQKHILFILVVVMVLSVHTQSDRKYCDEEVHCDGHGICIVDEDLDLNRCHCDEGYITTGGEYAEIQCDYKQKDQLTAFLLHFFLGVTVIFDQFITTCETENIKLYRIRPIWSRTILCG